MSLMFQPHHLAIFHPHCHWIPNPSIWLLSSLLAFHSVVGRFLLITGYQTLSLGSVVAMPHPEVGHIAALYASVLSLSLHCSIPCIVVFVVIVSVVVSALTQHSPPHTVLILTARLVSSSSLLMVCPGWCRRLPVSYLLLCFWCVASQVTLIQSLGSTQVGLPLPSLFAAPTLNMVVSWMERMRERGTNHDFHHGSFQRFEMPIMAIPSGVELPSSWRGLKGGLMPSCCILHLVMVVVLLIMLMLGIE